MNALRTLFWRCREFLQKERFNADTAEEIRLHLERSTEQKVTAGMPPHEAYLEAQRQFGNVGVIQQVVREQRGWIRLEQLIQDVRYASRSLRKAGGYSVVVVLTLALGIGASSAIFSVVNAVVLQPLSFPAADQLVAVRVVIPAYARSYPTFPVSARFFQEWGDCPAFSGLALIDRNQGTLTGVGEPTRISVIRTSSNLFATLKVEPVLGRSFSSDDVKNHSPVVVLSDRIWRNRFSADPEIIGRTLTLDQNRLTVIGVLPANFRLPASRQFLTGKTDGGEPEAFLLKEFSSGELATIDGWFNYDVIGRLNTGVGLTNAAAQLDVIASRLAKLSGEVGFQPHSFVAPLHESIVGPARRGLFLLLGAIISVLLIACLNLSMLSLARAERQTHERAVRSALGASRHRLLRQSLIESFLLSLGGGVLGWLFAAGGLDILLQFAPADLPRLDEVRLSAPVLYFSLGAMLFTTVATGLAPACRASNVDASRAFRSSASRGATSNVRTRRIRYFLIAIEAGVSVLLLFTAAQLATSFNRLKHIDIGIRAPGVESIELAISYAKYSSNEARVNFHRHLLDAVTTLPGVVTAAITTALPLQGETWIDNVWVTGDVRPKAERPKANVRFISPDFFTTLGIPILAGRSFQSSDQQRKVVLISAQLAALLWPGQEPTGKKVIMSGDEESEVIGISGDVRALADQPPVTVIYFPYWANPPANVILVAKAAMSPGLVVPALRAAIRRVDEEVAVGSFRTMNDLLELSANQRQFQMRLVAVFALSAITLAGLGIYGVVSHSVAQRNRELGIRLVFGANPSALRRLVVRQGITPVAFGLIAGVIGAIIGRKILVSLLFETKAGDPLMLAAVAIVLVLVAIVACWLPASRATKIEPLIALRVE